MTALAPGRFSVNKVTPSVRLMWSARIRARMSAVPPAGYGTTILTVLAVCDHAPVSPRRMERAPAATRSGARRLGRFVMVQPNCGVSLPAYRGRFESFAVGEVRFWHIASVQREASIRSLLRVKRTYRERTGASPRLRRHLPCRPFRGNEQSLLRAVP